MIQWLTRTGSRSLVASSQQRVLTTTPNSNTSAAAASSSGIDGASLIAKALRQQGVEYMFGVVGIPIIEVAMRAQQHGIKFVGMRNEQSASYAASAIGYLSRRPAAALCVSGPGFVHTLAGMANASQNAWPLIVIGGSSPSSHESAGGFQELDQVTCAKNFAKYAARPSSLSRIAFYVEKAMRHSTYGRPGVSYIDLSAEMVTDTIDPRLACDLPRCSDAPRPLASRASIEQVYAAIKASARPLVIVGKGAAYSQAESEVRRLVANLNVPYLPTPMGKGVCDDENDNCVAAARSTALKQADLVVLLGARLNWMLHFGKTPRFAPHAKFVQVDLHAEELGNNTNSSNCIQVQADIKSFCQQMNEHFEQTGEKPGAERPEWAEWWNVVRSNVAKNKQTIQKMAEDMTLPLNYYAAYSNIKALMPKDCMVISEGANTMDTSRSILNHSLPRHRLDAGTFGTMGLGSGYAIAAALYCRDHDPSKQVVCIQGDSAFGFGGMEIETAFRYNLPVIFIIFNNNGIYGGLTQEQFSQAQSSGDPCLNIPPMVLTANARYEKMASVFAGFAGYFAETPEQIRTALSSAHKERTKPSIINISISPSADRKEQSFPWLTKAH